MTKKEVLQVAREQLAIDLNCPIEEWKGEITIMPVGIKVGRRTYQKSLSFFRMVCFGGQTLISADSAFLPWCEKNLKGESSAWILQYPIVEKIADAIRPYGQKIADGHLFYLPDPSFSDPELRFPVQWYEGEELLEFREDFRFQKALGFLPNCPDVLAVAAMNGGNLIGMAGASGDSPAMWQIGIDVIPEYRGKGVAASLTALLKREIMERGIVPFYGTAYSHLISQSVAYHSGFFPGWTEIYTLPEKEG